MLHALIQVAVDSRNPLNRQLFACLVLYMLGLGAQGCHRCALEICKLLLAMDLSNDVSHSLLHIDYYAIRSRKYDFLHFFARTFVGQHLTYVVPLNSTNAVETAEGGRNAWNISDLRLAIPNFAFSAALATFLQASNRKQLSASNRRTVLFMPVDIPHGIG